MTVSTFPGKGPRHEEGVAPFVDPVFPALATRQLRREQHSHYDEVATAAWSQVLNQYQGRADLAPNLVESVKGAAAHEKEVLQQVTEARANATRIQLPADILSNPEAFQQFEAAQAQLGSALSRLIATVEAYPDIKANQSFLALQSQLEGTERGGLRDNLSR
jgi:hypothetical protein